MNKIIRTINNIEGAPNFSIIDGDYKPGYLYGNVKTHKNGSPLRPIISQTPSVTYSTAKKLNDLISPYIPAAFSLRSTNEFLDIIRTTRPSNILASMDVESLFTNVPVDDTIDLICKKIYQRDQSNFKIPEQSLRLLLQICTKEAPFHAPDGKLYQQIDGIAMGSPLGPLFANFYMGCLEEEVFSNNPHLKPHIYTRYIDDIFISTQNENNIKEVIHSFESNSKLKFTHEIEQDKKLPFLDVLVERFSESFKTTVYVKSTNLGFCLNASSECPEKYQMSVINSFVKRAMTHCSTWTSTHAELKRVSQVLINNGYKKTDIDGIINKQLYKYFNKGQLEQLNTTNTIPLFYKNYMSSSYKEDERVLKNIIKNNVVPTDTDAKIKLIIYYKTRRTSNLIMKNSCIPKPTELQEVNLVYQYTCKIGGCSHLNSRYIGVTTTTLSRRLTYHLQDGAITRHTACTHNTRLTRQEIVNNTEIIYRENDKKRLRMAEAVLIHQLRPTINIQQQPNISLPSLRRPTEGTAAI